MSITKIQKDCQDLDVILRKLSNMYEPDYLLINLITQLLETKERRLLKLRRHRYRNSTD